MGRVRVGGGLGGVAIGAHVDSAAVGAGLEGVVAGGVAGVDGGGALGGVAGEVEVAVGGVDEEGVLVEEVVARNSTVENRRSATIIEQIEIEDQCSRWICRIINDAAGTYDCSDDVVKQ